MSSYDPNRPQQPGYGQQPPYPQGPNPYGYPEASMYQSNAGNGLATASLVCGILGFINGFTAIPAIILGALAMPKVTAAGNASGKTRAKAGIILGVIVIALVAVFVVLHVMGMDPRDHND